MRRFAWALGIVIATLGACGSFSSSEDTQPDAEAGTTTPPRDATSPLDAAAPHDAAPDVDDPLADGGPFSLPITTDNFERSGLPAGGPLGLVFNSPNQNWGPDICPVDASPRACSGTTVGFIDATDAHPGDSETFVTDNDLEPSKRKLRFDFGLSIPNSPVTQAQFAHLQMTDNQAIFFEINDGKYRIGDQFPLNDGSKNYNNNATFFGAIDGSWGYYQIYVDLDAKTATLVREGALVGQYLLRDSAANASFSAASFGLSYSEGNITELFDNVGIGQY